MGAIARKYIEDEGAGTPLIIVAEVSRKLQQEVEAGKESKEGRVKHLDFIRSASQIIEFDFDQAAAAGELDVEMKKKVKGWGLADSIILLLAKTANAKIVTGDEHFRTVDEAILIK